MKESKRVYFLTALTIVVFGLIYLVFFLAQSAEKKQSTITLDKAMQSLEKLYKKIEVTTLPPLKGNVDLEEVNMAQVLPDISKYPAQVDNTTPDFIEIFSSSEKATVSNGGADNDRWLVDMAEGFNRLGVVVNGKPVSVRIRGIASGAAANYICSGKYVPDVFSPSNELWGEGLKSNNVEITLVEKRLAGNVAGIVLNRSKHEEIIEKYGSVSLKTVTEAVAAGEITMGYLNPFESSTGANFLVSALLTFDDINPLGNIAVAAFEKFQQNIPFSAYSTLQMKNAAQTGALEGFVLESQQFMNAPNLQSDYIFTPYGARHDNPVYTLGQLTDVKQEILGQFIAYTKEKENQDLATKYGFNTYDDYVCELTGINGELLCQAQKIWKEKKNGKKEIIAVFVADVSESMVGDQLHLLKTSLMSGSKFIDSNCSVGLVTFSDKVNIALPIAKFDINQWSLYNGAVDNMSGGGGSAMFDAIVVGEKMLMDVKASNPDAKLLLFVLTDGESNVGSTLEDTRGIIEGLRVPIYTIGYNADIASLAVISNLNEAVSINADSDDVVYKIQDLFNAKM